MRPFTLFAAAVALLHAADPKPQASDYPVNFEAENVHYGVEYLVRSVSHQGSSIVVDSYLVVEIAVYPPKGQQINVSTQPFALRINGKKDLLFAQTPGIVAASVKYPDWERRARAEGAASSGNAGIIFGRPTDIERFPGDNRPTSRRLPNPVPPVSTQPDIGEQKPAVTPEDMVLSSALPEGPYKTPVAGNVYFAWNGKTEKIKTLELVMRTQSGGLVSSRIR